MIEILIVVLLLFVSYKLKEQNTLIKEQNDLMYSLQDRLQECEKELSHLQKKFYDSNYKS